MTTIEAHSVDQPMHQTPRPVRELARTILEGFSAFPIVLLEWQYRARERRQLLGLSDSALRDFGASRADAENESSKPFWKR